jgi:hypothetical protein
VLIYPGALHSRKSFLPGLKAEYDARPQRQVILHVGRGVWKLGPDPTRLQGAEPHMLGESPIQTAPDFEREAVCARNGRGIAYKQAVESVGFRTPSLHASSAVAS